MKLNKERKAEMAYYIDGSTGKVKYFFTCTKCKHQCKQSFRCKMVFCSKYERA